MNQEQAEKNVREFMEKYGVEGFLKLYFSKYLLKLVKSELKSRVGPDLSKDPGTIFYFQGNKIEKLSDIKKYEAEICKECGKRSDEIIAQLKSDKEFKDLFEGNIERINDKRLQKRFEKKLHEILDGWKEVD